MSSTRIPTPPLQSVSPALVSVVIPAHNCAQTVGAAIDSVLGQTYPNIEIIVINDGSRDATEAVLASYSRQIHAITQPNTGLAGARNAGMALARGEFIAWLDADDVCEPDRISLQVAYLQHDPALVLCSSDFSAFSSAGEIAPSHMRAYYGRILDGGGLLALFGHTETFCPGNSSPGIPTYSGHVWESLVWGNFFHPPTLMMRRSLWQQAGPLDPHIQNMCDFDWLIRASRFGKFGLIERPLLRYRLSALQMSGSIHTEQMMLDLVEIVNRIALNQPEYHRAHRRQFRLRQGRAIGGAASMVAEFKPWRALRYLCQSIAYGHIETAHLRTLAKILLPRKWLTLARHVKKKFS